ncbi:MAG: NAD(P)H-binding protein [Rhizobacter sp.]|nr:NAD(P)H-binding protein [Rhizobacter sp.]
MSKSSKTALVLGATGGIGGEVARQLQQAGWQVKALVRDRTRVVGRQDGIDWIEGDAMNAADVLHAAQGASAIVHAVNPPGYQRWGELVLPMMANTIAAARATGARIVLPGTVYNYGPDAGARVAEDAPQHPLTRKGAIRVSMERLLEEAAATGVRSVVVRAGDFFGPRCGNSWFAQGVVRPGKPVRSVTQVSRNGAGHQWAYLPDVARTMVLLLAREATLPPFARFHMAGHWDANGAQLAQAVQRVVRAAGGTEPKVGRFPRWVVTLTAPVVRICREMHEMRYLWERPLQLRNEALVAELGQEPHTPLDQAVRETLEGLGCLPAAAVAHTTVQQRSARA